MRSEQTKIDVKRILQGKSPALAKKLPDFLIRYLAKIIHQDELNDILDRYGDKDGVDFMRELISYFDLRFVLRNTNLVPSEGRFIFASNHPLGGLDGICLATVIGDMFDGKVRYLVNDLLLNIRNLQSIFIPINKHGSQRKRNVVLINDAYASENQIITFPAGLCSRKIDGMIQDLEWKKSFVQKAVEYRRDIVPVFFDGQNSSSFYNLARLRKRVGLKANVEMLYLPDEMFKAKGKEFSITFGEPVPWQTFDNSRSYGEWATYMRERVYNLK
jgi:putative hemolysin